MPNPLTSTDWERLLDRIGSPNKAIRFTALTQARIALNDHLTHLGFPPNEGHTFDAMLAAARAGYVPASLLHPLIQFVNLRNRVTYPDSDGAAIDSNDGRRLIQAIRDECAIVAICNESTEILKPTPSQQNRLQTALNDVRSQILDERQVALHSAVGLLTALQATTKTSNPGDATLKAASGGRISGSLAARLLLAIRIRHSFQHPKGHTHNDDQLLDGVSAVCALFGLVADTPPRIRLPGDIPPKRRRPSIKTDDLSGCTTTQATRPNVLPNTSIHGSADSPATSPNSVRQASQHTPPHDGLQQPALRRDGVPTQPGPAIWVVLERFGEMPFYRDYPGDKVIGRRDLYGAASTPVIKALPSQLLSIRYIGGIPHLQAAGEPADTTFDGHQLRPGEPLEILDSPLPLVIAGLSFTIRRIRHVAPRTHTKSS